MNMDKAERKALADYYNGIVDDPDRLFKIEHYLAAKQGLLTLDQIELQERTAAVLEEIVKQGGQAAPSIRRDTQPDPHREDKPVFLNNNRSSATVETPTVGQMVEDKGIYVGTWEPKDEGGLGLGTVFNLYASPDNITPKTFNKVVKYVAGIHDYHGHSGFNHDVNGKTSDEALFDAMSSGNYDGEWFIPTRDILNNNLHPNRDAFNPENEFITMETDDYEECLYPVSTCWTNNGRLLR